MATTQPLHPPSLEPDAGDVLSWLADELGIGWGLLWGLVVPLLVLAAVGLVLTALLWRRYSRSPSSSTGADVFPGQVVALRSAEGSHGQVFVEGSWWSVRSDVPLRPGQDVRITAVERLELLVEPLESSRDKEES
ncbi:NfeD family protein [Janibacter cremeus]|uniref:Membrane protein implicated in regulation of membrane protease activity n=1 Tax=Janibacter cremeus TaxID=1285192 RepID=A0A852VNR2_9MICO|nr:NfeD family protein [Janibacter cremeus]NYF97328.1 membrane protein implicated in regulation of membrane protease activity [Janibacter cremeus]